MSVASGKNNDSRTELGKQQALPITLKARPADDSRRQDIPQQVTSFSGQTVSICLSIASGRDQAGANGDYQPFSKSILSILIVLRVR